MATYFGEVQELTSRAIEVDETENQPTSTFTIQTTENYSIDHRYHIMIVCIGDLAKAFSQVYLAADTSKMLAKICYSFQTVANSAVLYDGQYKNQKDKVAASLYSADSNVVVCEVPAHLPETIHVELLQEILNLIECSVAFVLTSAAFVTLKGDCSSCPQPPHLLCLANSFQPDIVLPRLWSPNFVGGFAAAVLTEFEILKKPAVCVINYAETNALDVLNVQAYEKLALLSILQNIIKIDNKSKLIDFVKKHSDKSNLYI